MNEMKLKNMINKTKMLTLATLVGASVLFTNCQRPTPQESTYRIHWANDFSWQGMGPGARGLSPFRSQYKVSHKQQLSHFPMVEAPVDEDGNAIALNEQQQLQLETEQAIMTAKHNGISAVRIQEMNVAYKLQPTEKALYQHFMLHEEKDLAKISEMIDGLTRTVLQTKTDQYLDTAQTKIGQEVKSFLKDFQFGGVPTYDKNGDFTGFTKTYSFAEEFGLEILGAEPQRIRPPSYVLQRITEANGIIKDAQTEYESAEDDYNRKMQSLEGMRAIVNAVGDNPQVYEYLKNKEVCDLIELQLGPKNIKRFEIVAGLKNAEDVSKVNYIKR